MIPLDKSAEDRHKIVRICLRAGIDYILDNRKEPWDSEFLNAAVKAGKIEFVPIGILHDGAKVAEIPLCWTDNDVLKAKTEEELISLSNAMLKNLISSSEDYLEEIFKKISGVVLVSSNMRNVLSGIGEVPGMEARFCTLVTVYKEKDNKKE